MNRIITSLLLVLTIISCDSKQDFKNEYISKINSSDKIEVKIIEDGQKKSIIFKGSQTLEFLKEVIKPSDLIEKNLIDNTSFPIDIILYSNEEVSGQIGIEFGHIQYIHYLGNKSFEFKEEFGGRIEEFVEFINQANKDN